MKRVAVVFGLVVLIHGAYQMNDSYAQVVEDWVQTYPGWYAVGVVTNDSGDIYVTGPTFADAAHDFLTDIIVAKYNQEGDQVWSLEFDETDDATNGTDASNWMAIDPSGNILITGTSFINTMGRTFITLKYDPDGNLLWKVRSTSGLEATRVETDGSGNVYIIGPSSTTPSARNYVTIKYDPNGVQQWVRTYNGPNSFDDNPMSLAVTADGRVAVTGESTGGVTSFDIATILYDTDGTVLWTRRHDGEEYSDRGFDVTFGPGGEVYVAGHVYDPDLGNTDAALIKYDEAGNEVWVRLHDGGLGDAFRRVRVDSQGNVIAAGFVQEPSFYVDFLTAKYDQDGTQLWLEELHLSDSDDLMWALTIGAGDDVYVTGESAGDVMTFKYNPDGVLQWTQAYIGGVFVNRGRAVSLDPFGGIIVAGESPFLTIRYTEDQPVGIPCEDVFFFNARCNAAGAAQAMVKISGDYSGETVTFELDGTPQVVALMSNGTNSIGKMQVPGAGAGAHTVELVNPGSCFAPVNFSCQVDAAPDPEWDAIWAEFETTDGSNKHSPTKVGLIGNYPNPFNPATTIRYSLSGPSHVTIRVYDLLGNELETLVSERQGEGFYSVDWNASGRSSGVYFYRFETGKVRETRKLVLVR